MERFQELLMAQPISPERQPTTLPDQAGTIEDRLIAKAAATDRRDRMDQRSLGQMSRTERHIALFGEDCAAAHFEAQLSRPSIVRSAAGEATG